MPVLMELSRIFIREMTDVQIIELSEADGDRTFPIVIGLPEAFAIERRLKGEPIPRPQTHDLLASTIRDLGGELKRIVINDLSDGTFYAQLVVAQEGIEIEIDSRPSDAIAVGIAQDVPIYVAEHVLEQTQLDQLNPLEQLDLTDPDAGDEYDPGFEPPAGFDEEDDDEHELDWD